MNTLLFMAFVFILYCIVMWRIKKINDKLTILVESDPDAKKQIKKQKQDKRQNKVYKDVEVTGIVKYRQGYEPISINLELVHTIAFHSLKWWQRKPKAKPINILYTMPYFGTHYNKFQVGDKIRVRGELIDYEVWQSIWTNDLTVINE